MPSASPCGRSAGRPLPRRDVAAAHAGRPVAGPPVSTRAPYLRAALALGAAVGVFGITFGVLASAAGLSVGQAVAMSLLTFTGASQFAVVGVLATGGTVVAAVGSALLLAARNGAYGLALSQTIGGGLSRRLVASQLVIDESTAMSVAQPDRSRAEGAFWATGLSVFGFWNLGTLIGAVGGQVIGDPAALGLDVAFPAGFLALLVPLLRGRGGRIAAVSGGLIALVALPFTPPGVPILLAVLGILPAAGDAASRASRTGDRP
jgi:4-azaleucine resistance transporter AzlC